MKSFYNKTNNENYLQLLSMKLTIKLKMKLKMKHLMKFTYLRTIKPIYLQLNLLVMKLTCNETYF